MKQPDICGYCHCSPCQCKNYSPETPSERSGRGDLDAACDVIYDWLSGKQAYTKEGLERLVCELHSNAIASFKHSLLQWLREQVDNSNGFITKHVFQQVIDLLENEKGDGK